MGKIDNKSERKWLVRHFLIGVLIVCGLSLGGMIVGLDGAMILLIDVMAFIGWFSTMAVITHLSKQQNELRRDLSAKLDDLLDKIKKE